MNKKEFISKAIWKLKYIDRLIENGFDKQFAIETFKAGIDNHDYEECPIFSADEDLSYFND